MKTKNFILSLTVAAFLTSAIPSGSHSLEIGAEAPAITLSHAARSLGDFSGQEVIVNFWSAADPASRLANRQLSDLADSHDASLRCISICIDDDNDIAEEIAKIDRISSRVISLKASDVTPDVLSDFQTSRGCRAFRIDRFGRLKAATPAASFASILS